MPDSKFEFRAVTSEELPEFRRLIRYVFADSQDPSNDDEEELIRPEWTTAAFHKGKIVATSGGFPFKMRLNGRGVQVDGVTDVGTQPGFRRQGLVREMITQRLMGAYERGQPGSILWASMAAIYQRFGYGLGNSMYWLEFDPRFVSFQFGEPAGGYVRILDRESGRKVVPDIYRRFIQDRNLCVHRSDVVWGLIFNEKNKRSYCAVHFNDDDEPDGYMTYTTREYDRSDPGPNQRFGIRDMIYFNMDAYRGLLEFVLSHDLVGRATMGVPLDDPAWSLVLEPRNLQPRLSDGIWLRVVDVAKLTAQRNYAMPIETVFKIGEDAECPWNVGSYVLRADNAGAEVERTETPHEFQISINGLASLLCGSQSLSQLVRSGRAAVEKESRLPSLDAAFATKYQPFCMDDF